MATNQNETARSGREARHPESHSEPETLAEVLERIQRMRVKRAGWEHTFPLIYEDWDWLVVLQCLQDHNLFKSNPKRPPLLSFEVWMHEQNIPQYVAQCTVRSMSRANNHINGARYPWTEVQWEPQIVARWRGLYRQLARMLAECMV